MSALSRHRGLLITLLSLCVYLAVTKWSIQDQKGYRIPPLKFLFPDVVVQMLSFGDPYLATNINYARVVTLFHYSNNNAAPRSILLGQSSQLNAKHLDNMYQAAVMPWEGFVNESLHNIGASAEARYWDWVPVFMVGMIQANFKYDFVAAAALMNDAAARAATIDTDRSSYLKGLAANIYSKGDNLEASLAYIEVFVKQAKQEKLKRVLSNKAERIRILIGLRQAAEEFERQFDRKLASLDELISSGVLKQRPEIFGQGYALDENGRPDFYEKVHVRNYR